MTALPPDLVLLVIVVAILTAGMLGYVVGRLERRAETRPHRIAREPITGSDGATWTLRPTDMAGGGDE